MLGYWNLATAQVGFPWKQTYSAYRTQKANFYAVVQFGDETIHLRHIFHHQHECLELHGEYAVHFSKTQENTRMVPVGEPGNPIFVIDLKVPDRKVMERQLYPRHFQSRHTPDHRQVAFVGGALLGVPWLKGYFDLLFHEETLSWYRKKWEPNAWRK